MKKLFTIVSAVFFCALSPLFAVSDPDNLPELKFTDQGIERSYYLYLPDDLPENAPLLFYLHGYGNEHPKAVEFCKIADKEKFAVCIPHAAVDTYGKHGWNAGYEIQKGYTVDDIAFLKNLAGFLQKKYGLSRRNVFVTGHSNGGEMCYLIAYKAPDFVRAVGPIAGLTMKWMYDSMKPVKAVPLIEIHGTEDKTSLWNGCFDDQTWGPYISVPLSVQTWAAAARCDREITEELPLAAPDARKVTAHKYLSDSNGGIQVQLYEVKGGGHGLSTKDINYHQVIWDFFKNYLVEEDAVEDSAISGNFPKISESDHRRAVEIVSRMTLEQKCLLVTGQIDGFHTAELSELGIPSVRMADGPQGVRNNTNSTYYPSGISIAAAFNRDRAREVGEGIGLDASARGVRIMLCPGVNIYRSPLCGRNFEYYGEDPYLASETASNYIQGIQSKRVIATIKHFALNNQEYDRHWTGTYADERTINEIYFATFRKAVQQAGVGAVMTSYNPVNGVHAAENAWLIGQLRSWGHRGIVMSDWTSTYTTYGCLTSGLDLEMPRNYALGYEEVRPFVENGVVSEKLLDEKCVHILQTFSAFGLLDKAAKDDSIPEDYEVSRNYAYQAALEGPVLLKNNGVLPIRKSTRNNIVLVGPNADYVAFGGGSGRMDPFPERNISVLQGLQKLGKGYRTAFAGKSVTPENQELIKKASVVVICAGFNSNTETEGSDRTYSLPEGQDEMILKVCELNPNVVVLVNSGGEVDVRPWFDKVSAVMMNWYSGQEGGNAVAALLSGAVSPSGRLPFTFWGSLEDNVTSGSYSKEHPASIQPGRKTNRDPHPHTQYREGIFLGYRAVGKFGKAPMFPFGYGLTYSSFEYSDLDVSVAPEGVKVSFTVSNTGKESAAEAAQVYVAPLSSKVERPVHELKGYQKKLLKKGESARYEILLDMDAFKYYDASTHSWVLDNPDFEIQVGASSDDIKLSRKISIR